MQDQYHAFRRDLVSALQMSPQAERQPDIGRTKLAAVEQFDPADYIPLDTSGVGEFPWQWDLFGTFSAETWNFLNTLTAPSGMGGLRLTGGLTTWYYNVISATAYLWTDADRAAVRTQITKATHAQSRLIQNFQSMNGPITPADRTVAASALGVTTMSNLIYVIDYQIGFVWSGRQAAGLAPLSASAIRRAPLDSLFAHAPPKASKILRPDLRAAFDYHAAWEAEIDRLWNLSRAIRDAADNAHQPELSNQSGMYTVDRSGANVVRNSFAVTPAVTELQRQLSSAATITLTFSVQKTATGDTIVSIPGKRAKTAPPQVLALAPHKGKARQILAHDGAGSRAEVQVTYHGPAEVSVAATPFAQAQRTGWYYEHPILEAAINEARGASDGYQFQLPIGGRQDADRNLGTLQKLLICRGVTLRVTYPDGDAARLAQSVPSGTGVCAVLAGDMVVGASNKADAVALMQTDAGSGAPGFVLNVGANGPSDEPGPLAHVIGARVNHPFSDTSSAVPGALAPNVLSSPSHIFPPGEGQAPGAALVSTYERLFGTVTPAQMQDAGVKTPLAFIFQHVLGAEWSQTAQRGQPPLTISDMKAAQNLRHLFPGMPLNGIEVLTELHAYLANQPNA